MASHRGSITSFVAFGAALGLAPVSLAGAATPPTHTFQHGLYAQAHFSTLSACTTARNAAVNALNSSGASSVSGGTCHASSMTVGGTKTTAYLYDVTYRAGSAYWPTDRDLGASPAATAGAHSFRTTYSAASQADATTHLNNVTTQIKNLPGGKVTASPGVTKNAQSGQYTYEVDYDSRVPLAATDVEIAETPGVTTAVTPPATPTGHVYQHGFYAQGSYPSAAACSTASSSATSALKNAGATAITAGPCHPVDMLNGTTKQSGYLVDITYRAAKPQWSGDADLGSSPAASAGAHSFRDQYSATTEAEATWHFTNDTNAAKAVPGGAVTYSTGVKKNAATGRYEYEIDYNSRVPTYANHVEISEKPGVTSPSLGVKTPIPTPVTGTAAGNGVTKPGDGTMNWPNGNASAPAKATAPAGTVKSPGTSTSTTGTVTSQPSGGRIGMQGIDISGNTSTNDWAGWKKSGVQFIYTKATEGTYYTNPKFESQYDGAYSNGIIRGAYHFANPASSTGADQADYFIAHGGGWSADGKTLPGVIDMEWNPYGDMCYGLSQSQMTSWTRSFINEYRAKTGVNPAIYTASIWWNRCVGSASFNDVPLWIAQYNTTLGALPTSWNGSTQTIWQNAALNSLGYDTDIFNGTLGQLSTFATTGRRN